MTKLIQTIKIYFINRTKLSIYLVIQYKYVIIKSKIIQFLRNQYKIQMEKLKLVVMNLLWISAGLLNYVVLLIQFCHTVIESCTILNMA